jgi:type III restriction enzyme
LPPELRSGLPWHYALIGESIFHDWRQNGARLGELLAYSKVRTATTLQSQGDLALGDGI